MELVNWNPDGTARAWVRMAVRLIPSRLKHDQRENENRREKARHGEHRKQCGRGPALSIGIQAVAPGDDAAKADQHDEPQQDVERRHRAIGNAGREEIDRDGEDGGSGEKERRGRSSCAGEWAGKRFCGLSAERC